MRRRPLLALAVGLPVVLALAIPLARRTHADVPIAKLTGTAAAVAPPAPKLEGLDLAKIEIGEQGVTAPLPDKKLARLSVDPVLQHTAETVMAAHKIPEAVVVLMDVETGKILAYASHLEKGPKRDLATEATAPAASVFKVVTGTSLVEHTNLEPDQRECYSGGEQRITAQDLVPDPKRDKWCTTVSGAMGRSLNTVFARLALTHLKPPQLDETAKALHFGTALPFDVPVQASTAKFPEDGLGFARTAAGFWNTTLSPLHATWLAAAIARGGEPVRPTVVNEVVDDGKVVWSAPSSLAQKRIMRVDTAHAVTTMMESTVTDGTSYKAFHDGKGRSFLPGVSVAGKTGTLTDANAQRYYTWFMGFAPSKPVEGAPSARKVAFATLVVNDPKWEVKANVVAREVLRAYFAEQKVPGVTAPQTNGPQPREADAPSTVPATKHRLHRGS